MFLLSMMDLTKRAFVGLIQLLLRMAAMLFSPGWTVNYWQAWFGGISVNPWKPVAVSAASLVLMNRLN